MMILLAFLGALLTGSAQAALPPAPLRVTVSPGSLHVGAPARITVEVQSYLTPEETGVAMDMYVVRLPGGTPVPRHLWPTGVWSTMPGPYLRDVLLSRLGDTPATWSEEGPVGWITLTVLFVRPGADPANRDAWVFRPIVRRLRVVPGREGPVPWTSLLTVGAAALVAVAIVLLAPWPRPPAAFG